MLTKRQILLGNLNEMFPPHSAFYYLGRAEARKRLIEWIGRDLGDDAKEWSKYLQENFTSTDRPRPALLINLIDNSNGLIAPDDPKYLPREQARLQLITLTGLDFNGDKDALRQWMQQRLVYHSTGEYTLLMTRLLQAFSRERTENRKSSGVATPGKAYEDLKALTGQDFGHDWKQWSQWINEHLPRTRPSKGLET